MAINIVSSPASVSMTSGGAPQDTVVNTSHPTNLPIDYSVSSDESWLTTDFNHGTTEDTQDIIADPASLSPGVYHGNITLTPNNPYIVISNGLIPIPYDLSNRSSYKRTNMVLSPVDDSFYFGAFLGSIGVDAQTYLVKMDRSTNTTIWTINPYSSTVPDDPFFMIPDLVDISPDGVYLYVSYHASIGPVSTAGVRQQIFEKRLTSDGSLVGSQLVVMDLLGTLDTDVAIIAGTPYWAVAGAWAGGTSFSCTAKLVVIDTIAWSVVCSSTYDPGTSTGDAMNPLAFDASGNVWWRTVPTVEPGPFFLEKIAVPADTKTSFTLADTTATAWNCIVYDPDHNDLIVSPTVSGIAQSYNLDGTIGSRTVILSTVGGNLASFEESTPSRLRWGANVLALPGAAGIDGGSMLPDDLSACYDTSGIRDVNNNASAPFVLDDTTANPHKTSLISMTLWCHDNHTGLSNNVQYFDIVLLGPAIIPVEFHVLGASDGTGVAANLSMIIAEHDPMVLGSSGCGPGPHISIDSSPIPNGTIGVPYPTFAFTIDFGGTPDFLWTIDGQLPPGLTLSSDGILSGTPITAGTYTFTVKVTDMI